MMMMSDLHFIPRVGVPMIGFMNRHEQIYRSRIELKPFDFRAAQRAVIVSTENFIGSASDPLAFLGWSGHFDWSVPADV